MIKVSCLCLLCFSWSIKCCFGCLADSSSNLTKRYYTVIIQTVLLCNPKCVCVCYGNPSTSECFMVFPDIFSFQIWSQPPMRPTWTSHRWLTLCSRGPWMPAGWSSSKLSSPHTTCVFMAMRSVAGVDGVSHNNRESDKYSTSQGTLWAGTV